MTAYMTTAEVAKHYRTSEATVRYWRMNDYGPKGAKVGRRVLYPLDEIERFDAWLVQHPEKAPTVEPESKARPRSKQQLGDQIDRLIEVVTALSAAVDRLGADIREGR